MEARAKSHTLKKNNHAGHVFRVDFFNTWKNRHVDVLKNLNIKNFTNEGGQSLNKITITFFCRNSCGPDNSDRVDEKRTELPETEFEAQRD